MLVTVKIKELRKMQLRSLKKLLPRDKYLHSYWNFDEKERQMLTAFTYSDWQSSIWAW
jgi:3-methyladenine DNA glycosylase AlkD